MASMVWTLPSHIDTSKISLDQWKGLVNAGLHHLAADVEYFLNSEKSKLDSELTWRQKCLSAEREEFNIQLPVIQSVSDVACFPLKMSVVSQYVKPNIALIGDAAHVVHPLAGQGLNLGIQDVKCLTQTIADSIRYGQSPGDMAMLEYFESRRKAVNAMMAIGVDTIHDLFGNRKTGDALGRAMDVFEYFPFAKVKHFPVKFVLPLIELFTEFSPVNFVENYCLLIH